MTPTEQDLKSLGFIVYGDGRIIYDFYHPIFGHCTILVILGVNQIKLIGEKFSMRPEKLTPKSLDLFIRFAKGEKL